MRHFIAIAPTIGLIGILASVLLAAAAELPSRKPGEWDVRMSTDNRAPIVVKQCIDAATDQMLQSSSGPLSAAACPKRDVERSGDKLVIDSTCTFAGKPASAHAVVAGSFDGEYAMNVTTKGEGLPAGLNMTINAKWVGACPADQKPGDVIMPSGVKINVPEMQKRVPSSVPGLPPP